jgi:nitroimidazol reductase NimA-like FMN-containing flavoprotein (pyridoxamine 5'-phosphate oxidase superfamily)
MWSSQRAARLLGYDAGMDMRRADRQVSGQRRIDDILGRAMVGHLGLADDAGSYVVPVSFAHVWRDTTHATVYIHGAGEGRKLAAIAAHPDQRICFQAEIWLGVADKFGKGCDVSIWYESVMGFGRARVVTASAEAVAGLRAIVSKFAPWYAASVDAEAVSHITVIALDLDQLTAKANLPQSK